jgi:hypothetical protein
MHTPCFAYSGTALVVGPDVTWRRFTCQAACLNEANINFAVMLESGMFCE